ncbi:MAG: phosphate ABC transporter substrate-binding/OmpA family protein [Pseudomonadota bacterium]
MTTSPLIKRMSRVALLVAAAAFPTAVLAADVTLKSSDGTVNIVGEFIDFKDDHYVVRTALGDLRIAAARVRCDGADCPVFDTTVSDVKLAGSDAMGTGLMPLLMSGFASFLDAEASTVATPQEGQLITTFTGDGGFGDEIGSYLVTSTSSADAFQTLKQGAAEIGMSARRILPQEARDLKKAGAGNMVSPQQEHIVAIDSLVVITHPENEVQSMTMAQLRQIYTGEITNWSALGGEDRPIKVIGRDVNSGTSSIFNARVFGDESAALTDDLVVASGNNAVAAMVNEDPGAVGYVGYAFQRGAKAVTLINDCGIPMVPDAFSARTEEYALQRRLYLYNRADLAAPKAQSFMSYAVSKDADAVIAKAGFIDLGVDLRKQSLEGERARMLLNPSADTFESGVMREMLGQMLEYDRLSTTFRFKTGSFKMDERGRIDLARLVAYLKDRRAGTKVLVVGFTDSVGAFESNRDLSKGRAGEVMNTLKEVGAGQIDHVSMDYTGFGEIAPSACNIDDNGRAINRRVEIWIERTGQS